MNTGSFKIKGGDYQRAGMASSNLKRLLKKINVEPAIIRRAMIAAYEAEMNVVIHAHNGNMRFSLNSDRIDMEVTDEGPGIPDIEMAMKEGYSTAPAEARDLGFGAGMGLPNIKNNSDRFKIESRVGEGTILNISIHLKPSDALESGRNSIRVIADKCNGCLRCLRVCPTSALRVRGGAPEILKHLCIDCTACMDACETGALTMNIGDEMPDGAAIGKLIVPHALLAGLGPGVSPLRAMEALHKLGFAGVSVIEEWEDALRNALVEYAREKDRQPIISPVCPAIVNLIEVRFPSLIENLAPFLSPIEAAKREYSEGRAAFVVECPSRRTELESGSLSTSVELIAPATVCREILKQVAADGKKQDAPWRRDVQLNAPTSAVRDVLEISGLRHVMRALEEAENGLLNDVKFLELYACEGCCFGSPLFKEDPFIARHRWRKSRDMFFAGATYTSSRRGAARAARRNIPFTARAGVRLDADISRAIAKLSEIENILQNLPGKDCGVCGAPTCGAFAEDIVIGRATINDCAYLERG